MTIGASALQILWGGNVIGILAQGSTTMTKVSGVTVSSTKSGVSGYTKYTLEVAGDREAEFTELRIQGYTSNTGLDNGRILASVDLKAVDAGGSDNLIGGEGNDILYGQGGDDKLWGGIGDGTKDGSVNTFVYSFNKDNGADTIMDFEVGTDRIYLTDVLDAYNGLNLNANIVPGNTYSNSGENIHITRGPGTVSDNISVVRSDENLTIKDFRYDDNDGDDVTVGGKIVQGQYNQYITVEGDSNNNVVINFGSGEKTVTGAKTAFGSVTLEGVKFGNPNDGKDDTYGSVEELFGYNNHQQILWATTDGFQIPEGNSYAKLTNMDKDIGMTVNSLKIDEYYNIF